MGWTPTSNIVAARGLAAHDADQACLVPIAQPLNPRLVDSLALELSDPARLSDSKMYTNFVPAWRFDAARATWEVFASRMSAVPNNGLDSVPVSLIIPKLSGTGETDYKALILPR